MRNTEEQALYLAQGSKGGKGGGGQQHIAQEAPNTLQSKSVLRVVELVSEGEIVGLVNGAKSIYFDDTPLQNSDDSFNFNGVTFDTRAGTPDQAHISGFSSVEEEVAVGVKVTTTSPVVRTITDADTDAAKIVIRIPALTNQDTSNGNLNGSSVEFKIDYQPNGGSYITATQPTVTGKTVSPYEIQYRVELTGDAPWNIRVSRITADNEAANIQNDIYFSSYTRVIDRKLIYPDSALVAMSVDSSLFGNAIPTRSYDIKGIILEVPSNYDAETKQYTGVWDGTFQMSWTDNPAWVLYNLITNKRWGLGEYIKASEVDKFAFYSIGQYCDEFIDDGKGGTEPRFTFNGIIETREEALKVLQVVASAFRGMLYWGADATSGIITPVHNAPRDPVKIFSQANVIGGLFNYSGTALEARHSAVYVTWNDPDNGYEATIEVVEDVSLIEKYGYRRLDVVAYGCTSRGQAHRFGKWILDSETHESEMVTYNVGLADADLRPGDVVKIQDDHYANVRFGGRIVTGTTTQLTLDDSVTLETGETYTIDVVLPDGTIEAKTITDSPGTYSTVNLNSALSDTPAANTMWVITSTDLSPRQFQVVGVKEVRPVEFEVTAHLFDPNKFARVEQDIYLPDTTFTKLNTGPLAPPTDLAIHEYLFQNGPLVQSGVSLSWTASPDSRIVRYEAEAKRPLGNNNFELIKSTQGITCDLEGTIDGVWSFRVRGLDALGNYSPYLNLLDVVLSINSQPPDDVDNFSITVVGPTSILSWDPVLSLNLNHYEIRYNPLIGGSADWNSSQIINNQVPKGATTVSVPSNSGSYFIKAVSVPTPSFPEGIYSENAAIITTEVDALFNFNFIDELVEDPTFPGGKHQVAVSMAGNLELAVISGVTVYPTGTYQFSEIIDVGDVFTSRITPHVVISGNNLANLVDDWSNVDNIANVDGVADGQWGFELLVSTTNDDPFEFIVMEDGTYLLKEDDLDKFYQEVAIAEWSEYQVANIGDYVARAYDFKCKLYSFYEGVTPSVEELAVEVDMPDIIQEAQDIATSASGTAILFPADFYNEDPAIAISAQNLAQGDYYTITLKSKSGFTIQFFNSSDVGISRTFDYVAKGYGAVSP